MEALVGGTRCAPNAFTALARQRGKTKLRAIREALRIAKRVWLATDCDREGQLIGQEISSIMSTAVR